jgi:putative FmdB family regulatory protein
MPPIYVMDGCECGRFEVFQRFYEGALRQCPTCGQPVHRVIQAPRFQIKKSSMSDEDVSKQAMQSRLGRKVEKGERFHTVPLSGEVVKLDGKPRAQQQEEIFNAHARAKDTAIDGLTPADIDVQS